MGGWWHQETKSAFQMFPLGTPKKVQTCFSGSAPAPTPCATRKLVLICWMCTTLNLFKIVSLTFPLFKKSLSNFLFLPPHPTPDLKKRVWPPEMLPLPPPLLVVVVGSVFCTYLEDVQGQVLLKSKKPSAKGCKGKGRGPSQNGWGISDEGSSK